MPEVYSTVSMAFLRFGGCRGTRCSEGRAHPHYSKALSSHRPRGFLDSTRINKKPCLPLFSPPLLLPRLATRSCIGVIWPTTPHTTQQTRLSRRLLSCFFLCLVSQTRQTDLTAWPRHSSFTFSHDTVSTLAQLVQCFTLGIPLSP